MRLDDIADKIASDIYRRPISPSIPQSAVIRHACDTATARGLSRSMLDLLCDMVERRLRNMPVSAIRE